MPNFNDIIEYDDFLENNVFSDVTILLDQPKWAFANYSTPNASDKPFWVMGLTENPFFTIKLFDIIQNKIGKKFDLLTVYANGQTFGLDGSPHIDSPDKRCYTLLIYVNRNWDLLWGGNTVFVNKYFDSDRNSENFFDGDTSLKTKRIVPQPNKAILFPSQMIHYAESPSRSYFGLRTTLAYKLIEI